VALDDFERATDHDVASVILFDRGKYTGAVGIHLLGVGDLEHIKETIG
jgi:hypothetical protein